MHLDFTVRVTINIDDIISWVSRCVYRFVSIMRAGHDEQDDHRGLCSDAGVLVSDYTIIALVHTLVYHCKMLFLC